jgi:hypothetical protein
MNVINVKKSELNKRGIKDFMEWKNKTNSLYIGRNMTFYVPGTNASKWQNPFTLKKYGIDCLNMYESHVRKNLIQDIEELEGKELGCWCKIDGDGVCHGDILIKLLNEVKQSKINSISSSDLCPEV